MGSMNLKAIAVRGHLKVKTADPATITKLARLAPKRVQDIGDMKGLQDFGTASVLNYQNTSGGLPTRNYTSGTFEKAEDLSGETMSETILQHNDTCYACVVRCKRVVEITEGAYKAQPLYGGPEYESLCTLGSYCGIDNMAAIAFANEICNMYGVDTITCGATIAFAMECFEKGIIGLEQTDGLELRFGNIDAMLDVLKQIVTNSGSLGTVLSKGSARAAKLWGSEAEDCLITVKNQEAPAHMPQAKKSLAVIYAVNPFGADHQSSEHDPMYEEGASDLYLDRLVHLDLKNPPPAGSLGPEKVRFAAYSQISYSLLDTLELCQFVWGPAWTLYGPMETVDFVRAVTGWNVSLEELMKVGERRLNLMRVFNSRESFTRKDDTLPKKFYKSLKGVGPTANTALDPQEFESALDLYYQLLGWTQDGIPTPDKLMELGLEWAIKYLPKNG